MTGRPTVPALGPFKFLLEKWMPKAEIRPAKNLARFDAVLTWKAPRGPVRYLMEEKRHFRFQDIHVVVDQLTRMRAALGPDHAKDRLLLFAPHVRPQQAAVLERADIDYVDLAGDARLRTHGLFVHVEGRQPPKEQAPGRGRPQKGWVKIVLVLLARPDLATAPYRVIAEQAGAALGTVATCMNDLAARGLLQDGNVRRILDKADETEVYVPIDLVDRDTQKALVAQPAERNGNLLLIDPPAPLATLVDLEDGLPVVPDLLAYAELRYRGTQQALEAAELLLPKVLR